MKYIVFYDNNINAHEQRYVIPSCQNKAGYVMETLAELGDQVDVISPSLTLKKKGYFKGKIYSVSDNIKIHLPATMGFSTVIGKVIRRIWQWYATNVFVYSRIKNGETVIAYHSVSLSGVLRKLKKRKNIKLILHAEEIYSDVSHNEKDRIKEDKVFAVADAFVFPTEKLNEKINRLQKPYAVAHGTYKAEASLTGRKEDGRIHCVYAGTFDPEKGGAEAAVKAAEWLDERYVMHILGFGAAKDIENIKALIEERKNISSCEIIYEGEKRGSEFTEFLQQCHIGLSTQNPNKQFNDSSFPSKVLTYMANGLSVVTVRIPVLETSDVNEFVTYYDGDDPESLAKAIIRCCENGLSDDRDILNTLHKKFKGDLKNTINELQ